MKNLSLELQDTCIIGRHGDFARAIDPLEDTVEKIMIGVDSGSSELTCVDLDGDYNIIKVYQIQDNTTESDVREFVNKNIDEVIKWVRDDISNMIDQW